MKFIINKEQLDRAPEQFLRQAGYAYLQDRHTGQDSFVRRLGQNFYPRFHVYLNHMGQNVLFNIHLDQKKPSYSGAHAHNAEYDGEVVEREASRLKELAQPEEKDDLQYDNKEQDVKNKWWPF